MAGHIHICAAKMLFIQYECHNELGQLHKENGPARILIDLNSKLPLPEEILEWWYNGERIKCDSQEEFERKIKLKVFW